MSIQPKTAETHGFAILWACLCIGAIGIFATIQQSEKASFEAKVSSDASQRETSRLIEQLVQVQADLVVVRTQTQVFASGPLKVEVVGGSVGLTGASRILRKDQIEAMLRSLRAKPSKVAVYTIKHSPERIAFASQLANVFKEAGWTVMTSDDDNTKQTPPLINFIDEGAVQDLGSGAFVMCYRSGGSPPKCIADEDNLSAAEGGLRAGAVKHSRSDLSIQSFYVSGINTSIPIIFVGSATDKP